MKKYAITFLSLIIFITGCNNIPEIDTNLMLDVSAAKEMLNTKDNIYLIDVRTSLEYDDYHIEGAINISSIEIEKIKEENIAKDDYIILYCQSGARSKEVYGKLKDMGYTNVYNTGSINNWVK